MCRWRQVQHIFQRCNHVERLEDEMIYCDDRWCKFSAAHAPNCGPKCSETCWQRRQFPEQYDRYLDNYCSMCRQAGHRV